jgi:hypothetical protein
MGGKAILKTDEIVATAGAAMLLSAEGGEKLCPIAVSVMAFGPISQIEIEATGAFGPAPTAEKPYVGPEALATCSATKRVDAKHHAGHFGGVGPARTAHGGSAAVGADEGCFAFGAH